eukprot:scaffold464682_cov34-Prasinocladus_malaysianus.AAC.1
MVLKKQNSSENEFCQYLDSKMRTCFQKLDIISELNPYFVKRFGITMWEISFNPRIRFTSGLSTS